MNIIIYNVVMSGLLITAVLLLGVEIAYRSLIRPDCGLSEEELDGDLTTDFTDFTDGEKRMLEQRDARPSSVLSVPSVVENRSGFVPAKGRWL